MPVRLRRQIRPRPDPFRELRPLTFRSDAGDITVTTVHVFETTDGGVAMCCMTGSGSINIVLPARLAQQVGNGLLRLAEYNR